MRKTKFKFPKALLNQVSECSNGYFLVTISEDNKFDVHQDLGDPLKHVGMVNFLEIYATTAQNNLRERPGQRNGDEGQEQD